MVKRTGIKKIWKNKTGRNKTLTMKKIIFKRIKMKGIPFLLLVISLLTARPVFGQTHNPASLQASTNQETPHFSLQQILTRIETNNPGLQQFALKTKSSFA